MSISQFLIKFLLLVCCCVLSLSCGDKSINDEIVNDEPVNEDVPNDEDEENEDDWVIVGGGFPPDTTLAGSVSLFGAYCIKEITASLGGEVLDGYIMKRSFIDLSKVTPDKVSMVCHTEWNTDILNIYIPIIMLSGKPYDVTFESSCDESMVSYKGIEYSSIKSKTEGWIKRPDKIGHGVSSKYSPATPDYDCEINIECTIGDKILKLTISSISSNFYY